jgi:3-dehydroquinate synthetase
MLKEAEVAVNLNILEKLEYKRLAELLYKFRFPRELPQCVKDNLNLFFSALNIDKKRRNQTLYFVLPHKIGEAKLHPVSLSSLKKALL